MKTIATELVALVETVSQKLEMISETDASIRPSSKEWSKKEIVGHMIDSAVNNHHRFVRAQQSEALSFPDYKQEEWVRLQAYNTSSWKQLVYFWRLYNMHLSHVVRHISTGKLNTACKIGSNAPVTLRDLMEDYLVHLRLHLKQLGL